MKITRSQLRQLIKEEVEIISEHGMGRGPGGRHLQGYHSESGLSQETAGDHFAVSREDLQSLLTVANDLNMAALGNPDEGVIRAAMDKLRGLHTRLTSKGPATFAVRGAQ